MSADRAALQVVRTPAYLAAQRLMVASGSWVQRRSFDALGHAVGSMDDALADLVMLGEARFDPAAGYRLDRQPLAREAGRRLLAGTNRHELVVRLQGDTLRLGVAKRCTPPLDGALIAELEVPVPQHLDGPAAAEWAARVVVQGWAALPVGGAQ